MTNFHIIILFAHCLTSRQTVRLNAYEKKKEDIMYMLVHLVREARCFFFNSLRSFVDAVFIFNIIIPFKVIVSIHVACFKRKCDERILIILIHLQVKIQ